MSWLEKASSRNDPLFAFDWDIRFEPPAGVGNLPAEYVEAIQVPLPKFDSDHAVFQARRYYFAKFEDFGVANCRFYIDNNTLVVKWLRDWQAKIKAKNGNYKVPSEYKGRIYITSKDAKDAAKTKFICYGVFPTQIPSIPFDSTGDRITLDVEFSIDKTEME